MIKFRAWHKELKQMLPVIILDFLYKRVLVEALDSGDFVAGHGHYWDLLDIELMQWTGWNDKNSNPIFDGDIIDYGCGDGVGRMKVQWDKDKCMFCFMWIGEPWDWREFDEFSENDLLIVGNIYFNPELLRIDNAPIQAL